MDDAEKTKVEIKLGYVYPFKDQEKHILVVGIVSYVASRKYVYVFRACFALVRAFLTSQHRFEIKGVQLGESDPEKGPIMGEIVRLTPTAVLGRGTMATRPFLKACDAVFRRCKSQPETDKFVAWMYVYFFRLCANLRDMVRVYALTHSI